MKRISVAIFACFCAIIAFAQPPIQNHFKNKMGGMPFKNLNLTDPQKQQMKQANEDFRKQMQALNSQENITVKEQRNQRETLLKTHKQAMENILTPEQRTQLANMKNDAKKQHKEMATKHLGKMKTELGLTDDQVAQLKANNEANHAKMEAIMKNNALDRNAKKEQMNALHTDMKNSIANVLTPEQKTKFETMKKEHKGKWMGRRKNWQENKPA